MFRGRGVLVVSPRVYARAWVVSPRARAGVPLRSDHRFGKRTGNSGARRHINIILHTGSILSQYKRSASAGIRSASARYVDYMHI